MKRFLAAIILMLAGIKLSANIADPNPGTLVQPDGSTIAAVLHGDEFGHTLTTPDGRPLKRDSDGFYRPGAPVIPAGLGSTAATMRETRTRDLSQRAPASRGQYHLLVILVEFSDLHFTIPSPAEAFSALLNDPGYSENGGSGSAADYYRDNSGNLFEPVFDVVGPVRLDRPYSYYGSNKSDGSDSHADQALYEACQLLDASVDFSRYDSDGDGYVDGVFYFYAGHNESEYAGEDTIWPHAWALYYYRQAIFDGVRVYSYACTSEYRSATGSLMCGIGTFCHEFGHVLGLPDLYDTDGAENGSADTMYEFSLMSNGSLNNSGRTPSNLTVVERESLGWASMPEETTASGTYSLAAGEAMLLNTTNEGEFFICEVRDGTGWDSYVPKGLVITHVDRSSNRVGRSTAAGLWKNGFDINCYKDHPCMYVVKAKSSNVSRYFPFPGAASVTTFSHDAWSGYPLPYSMRDIAFDGQKASFTLAVDPSKAIAGTVSDNRGNVLGGATVTATTGTPGYAVSTKTDDNGRYHLDLTDSGGDAMAISARLAGFNPDSASAKAAIGTTIVDFILTSTGADASLSQMGFTYILEYGQLAVGNGKTVDSVSWGRTANAITASVVYTDGSRELLTLDL